MKASPLAQASALNAPPPQEIPAEDRNALPPAAAIDANKKIIEAAANGFGQMMKACRTGLNTVVAGSQPEAARAPQQISSTNGDLLMAVGLAGCMAGARGGNAQPRVSAKPAGPAPAQGNAANPAPKAAQPAQPLQAAQPLPGKPANPPVPQKEKPAQPQGENPAPADPAPNNPGEVPPPPANAPEIPAPSGCDPAIASCTN